MLSRERKQVMSRDPLIVRPGDRPQPLTVIGTSVTVLADSAETGGMGFTVQQGADGAGPAPHCHPWDEAFYVLDGTIEFTVGTTTAALEAGSLVHVPAGTTHAFRYGPDGGKMIEMTGAGSKAAAMFTAFDREMPGEPELGKVLDIFERHDVKLMA
jgi:quercetin dioxygenase-like cupin family protein